MHRHQYNEKNTREEKVIHRFFANLFCIFISKILNLLKNLPIFLLNSQIYLENIKFTKKFAYFLPVFFCVIQEFFVPR